MTVDWSAVPGVLAACAAWFLLWALFYALTKPKPKPEPAQPPGPPNPLWEGLKDVGLLLISPIVLLLPVLWGLLMIAALLFVVGGIIGLLLIGWRAL